MLRIVEGGIRSKNKYLQMVDIDGRKFEAAIDSGSECVTLRESDARDANIKYMSNHTNLVGFNGGCRSLGKRSVLLTVDGISAVVDVLFVPDGAQDEQMILGLSFIDQQHVNLSKTRDEVKLQEEKSEVNPDIEDELENLKENHNTEDKCDDVKSVMPITVTEGEGKGIIRKIPDDQRIKELLEKNIDCFATTMKDLGESNTTKIKIEVNNDERVVYRPYRLPLAHQDIVRSMVDELLEAGIIRESMSENASPILLVNKKIGEKRMCVDYRRLNAITKKDKYPMPLISDQLDKLAGQKYFTTLDLASGYYQIPVEEDSKEKTAL